jgi:lactate dehydrogenase-like 2-hydroxyacid dehydrogenase
VKYTVVLTSSFPAAARTLLAGEFDVLEHPPEERSPEELATILGDADAAIVLPSDPVTREVLEANPNLHMLAVFGADCANVDVDAARELGVTVTNAPGTSEEQTARMAATSVRLFLRGQEPLHRVV